MSWDVGLPEEGCLLGDIFLEKGYLMNYWLVELSSFILLNSSFVRSNWILLASCKNVITSLRCFGTAIIFVFADFVLGLAVVDLVLVILSFSENIH